MDEREPQRRNLLHAVKLAVQGVLGDALNHPETLSTYRPDAIQLNLLCSDLEKILYYGLRDSAGMWQGNRTFWMFIEGLEWLNKAQSVSLSNIRLYGDDSITRQRAWLRQAVIYKKFVEHIVILTGHRTHLKQYYHQWAILCSDECVQVLASMMLPLDRINLVEVDRKPNAQPAPPAVAGRPPNTPQPSEHDVAVRAVIAQDLANSAPVSAAVSAPTAEKKKKSKVKKNVAVVEGFAGQGETSTTSSTTNGILTALKSKQPAAEDSDKPAQRRSSTSIAISHASAGSGASLSTLEGVAQSAPAVTNDQTNSAKRLSAGTSDDLLQSVLDQHASATRPSTSTSSSSSQPSSFIPQAQSTSPSLQTSHTTPVTAAAITPATHSAPAQHQTSSNASSATASPVLTTKTPERLLEEEAPYGSFFSTQGFAASQPQVTTGPAVIASSLAATQSPRSPLRPQHSRAASSSSALDFIPGAPAAKSAATIDSSSPRDPTRFFKGHSFANSVLSTDQAGIIATGEFARQGDGLRGEPGRDDLLDSQEETARSRGSSKSSTKSADGRDDIAKLKRLTHRRVKSGADDSALSRSTSLTGEALAAAGPESVAASHPSASAKGKGPLQATSADQTLSKSASASSLSAAATAPADDDDDALYGMHASLEDEEHQRDQVHSSYPHPAVAAAAAQAVSTKGTPTLPDTPTLIRDQFQLNQERQLAASAPSATNSSLSHAQPQHQQHLQQQFQQQLEAQQYPPQLQSQQANFFPSPKAVSRSDSSQLGWRASYNGVGGNPLTSPNIIDIISDSQYATSSELEKENAHFTVSEALIAAVEESRQVAQVISASANDLSMTGYQTPGFGDVNGDGGAIGDPQAHFNRNGMPEAHPPTSSHLVDDVVVVREMDDDTTLLHDSRALENAILVNRTADAGEFSDDSDEEIMQLKRQLLAKKRQKELRKRKGSASDVSRTEDPLAASGISTASSDMNAASLRLSLQDDQLASFANRSKQSAASAMRRPDSQRAQSVSLHHLPSDSEDDLFDDEEVDETASRLNAAKEARRQRQLNAAQVSATATSAAAVAAAAVGSNSLERGEGSISPSPSASSGLSAGRQMSLPRSRAQSGGALTPPPADDVYSQDRYARHTPWSTASGRFSIQPQQQQQLLQQQSTHQPQPLDYNPVAATAVAAAAAAAAVAALTSVPGENDEEVRSTAAFVAKQFLQSLPTAPSPAQSMSPHMDMSMSSESLDVLPGSRALSPQPGGRRTPNSSLPYTIAHHLQHAMRFLVKDADTPQTMLPLPLNLARRNSLIRANRDLSIPPMSGEVPPPGVYNDNVPVASPPLASASGMEADAKAGQQRATRVRGTDDWAPPRSQVIFNVQTKPSKTKVGVAAQNYRCTGCGLRFEENYVKKFRFCEYIGKFFCASCHSNSVEIIPALVLHKWDFKPRKVSNFAKELLHRIFSEPVYNIGAINANLYSKVKALAALRTTRTQLTLMKDYLRTCRTGAKLLESIADREYLVNESELYSMRDLLEIYPEDKISEPLRALARNGMAHVMKCELCQAKGFICEFCNNSKDILYPFQLGKSVQCEGCKSFFHAECYVKDRCPKCMRIRARESKRALTAAP
ncbi:hypothetical protein CAOG_01070 [Capsaspora owczarzaki ATCC 30864]|nr:hypothetical protein CAOG_01070 [Capsaspora owczarzaki ATCC 30864]|eukprot:XP_004365941.1 hypothetical protein CAOG_01070 [Capsaspora owczarzaki ATCC 30864]